MRQIKVKHQVLLVALCVEFCRSRLKRDLTFRTWSSPGVVLGGGCVGCGVWGFFWPDLELAPEEAQGMNEVSISFPMSWLLNNQSFSHA